MKKNLIGFALCLTALSANAADHETVSVNGNVTATVIKKPIDLGYTKSEMTLPVGDVVAMTITGAPAEALYWSLPAEYSESEIRGDKFILTRTKKSTTLNCRDIRVMTFQPMETVQSFECDLAINGKTSALVRNN